MFAPSNADWATLAGVFSPGTGWTVGDGQADVMAGSDLLTLIADVANENWVILTGGQGGAPGIGTFQKIGDVNVRDDGEGFVRMWGVAASVNNIALPVEMRDIADCDIQISVKGTTERHVLVADSTNTQLNVVRIGGTGASFHWSVYGEKLA